MPAILVSFGPFFVYLRDSNEIFASANVSVNVSVEMWRSKLGVYPAQGVKVVEPRKSDENDGLHRRIGGKPLTGAGMDRPASRRKSLSYTVTLAEVAAQAGVSAQTVSRALRFPDTVAGHTLARITAAVEATGYVPNLSASQLASNRSKTIAMIIPTLAASVIAETVQGMSDVLLTEGYQLFLGHTDYSPEKEYELVRSMLGRRPDGVCLIGTVHRPETISLLRKAGIPVVQTWDWTEERIDMLVGFSNRDAARAVVAHLAGRGYKKLAFAAVIFPGDYRAEQRHAGFLEGVAEHFKGKKVREVIYRDRPLSMSVGAELFHDIRQRYPEADAIVFSSDVFAGGALLECIGASIRVPDEIAITGFGDYDFAGQLHPGLTTVHVPARDIGAQSARLLVRRLNKQPLETEALDVGFDLVVREST
ncbi:LacI family DNA-binding transcriptional regulator [Burkholderia sp. Ax-1724]|uniref:substrate-binding domain-containing protein n=1 Tax=Burkholderia sp. Ax-1724 TaxID=2608336 RepID=UPI001962845A